MTFRQIGSRLTGFVMVAALAGCAVRAEEARPRWSHEGDKLALIITIGDYPEGTGWGDISSNNDFELIQGALLRHRFPEANIVRLRDSEATREGIERALAELLESISAGNVVVIHYSGHGQQVTDDDYDEIDGYDEALVPWGAPVARPGYDASQHLRDDAIYAWLFALRKKLGPEGDLLLLLDSCFSGSGSRGEALARGSLQSIGAPQERPGRPVGSDTASGFVDRTGSRGLAADESVDLAPFVLLAADRHDRLAEETKDFDDRAVGALSWTVAGALEQATAEMTYRDLFADVERRTARHGIENSPQAEGSLDRRLFGGRAENQDSVFRVISVDRDFRRAQIDGGRLSMVLPGAGVQIHSPGTRIPEEQTRLASGRVTHSDPFAAELVLEDAVASRTLAGGWAFLTEPILGGLEITFAIETTSPALGELVEVLRQGASNNMLIRFVEAGGDVVVREAPEETGLGGALVVEASQNGTRILGPRLADTPGLGQEILDRLQEYARNRYLRRLDLRSPGLEVAFEIVPCVLECSSDRICAGERCRCIREGDPSELLADGGGRRLAVGEGFGIRISNLGSQPAYVAILDLQPDGHVGMLWPSPEASPIDTRLEPQNPDTGSDGKFGVRLPGTKELLPFRACPPLGTDVLKLFATVEPVDFRRVVTRTPSRGETPGALDRLFDEILDGTRGVQPVLPSGGVSTFDVPITIDNYDP